MAERLRAQEFMDTEGCADWRVLAWGASAFFAGGLRETAPLVATLARVERPAPEVDLRPDGVTVRLPQREAGLTEDHVRAARDISAAARELGLRPDPTAVQDVNLTSVYLCCKAALPYMRRQGKGSIINTASFVAVMGAATSQISYSASKGGVLSMSRELGVQFAREGIRVNALCPGPVLTPLLAKFLSDDEKRQRRLAHIPMGRFGEAAEMVQGALFLASDESSYMTGQSLLIDGGITAAYTTPE